MHESLLKLSEMLASGVGNEQKFRGEEVVPRDGSENLGRAVEDQCHGHRPRIDVTDGAFPIVRRATAAGQHVTGGLGARPGRCCCPG